MHLCDQRTLGVILLVSLALVVVVKKAATRSLLTDRPERGVGLWLVHVFNMFFLLVVNPLVAVLLTSRRMDAFDPTLIDDVPGLLQHAVLQRAAVRSRV